MNTKWILSAALLCCVGAAHADVGSPDNSRRLKGEVVINELTGGAGQPVLTALQQDFPFLAEGITAYALGDVWGRSVLDARSRQLATVAVFAAQGNLAQMKVHAGYALRYGVSHAELKEIIYLTTVTSGFPRAIEAAQALREVFAEHPAPAS